MPSQESHIRSVSNSQLLSCSSSLCPWESTVGDFTGDLFKADVDAYSVRSVSDFDALILLSASARTALITVWTASWCPSCRTVSPLIRQLIEEEGAGEERGGVGYAEIEFDSPTLGDVAGRYGLPVSSI